MGTIRERIKYRTTTLGLLLEDEYNAGNLIHADEVEARIREAVAKERERCALIAEAHKGGAARCRRARGQKLSHYGPDVQAEIQAADLGEDIAAEIIAVAIRKGEDTND